MTKLLMMISGLVGISASSLPIFNKTEECVSNFATPQEWKITSAKELKKTVKANEWLYFAIDNIDLSSMGITDIDKLHEYNTIEVPDFFIRFFGKKYVELKGDTWDANRELGSEKWVEVYWDIVDNVTMKLEKASTIWVDEESNKLMMRLAYHASLTVVWPPEDPRGGLITFRSGSIVKFY